MSAWLAKGSPSAGEKGEAATELLGLDGNTERDQKPTSFYDSVRRGYRGRG
jgi:hypothetical protein